MTVQPTTVSISSADLQAAIVALIQQNNAELRQLIAEILPPLLQQPKKTRKTALKMSKASVTPPLPRKPYHELPFWKANPHLKPVKVTGYGLKKEVFEQAQQFFQQPDYSITETWFDNLD
jgi:hypothetical protein